MFWAFTICLKLTRNETRLSFIIGKQLLIFMCTNSEKKNYLENQQPMQHVKRKALNQLVEDNTVFQQKEVVS